MFKRLLLLTILLALAAFVWGFRENLVRTVKGGAFFIRDIPSGIGTQPVIDHTYGFHPAIWEVFYNGPDGEKIFDLAAEVGAPYMRVGFHREWIQKQNGTYDWSVVRKAVDRATARGIRLVPSIYHGNNFWAASPIPERKEPVLSKTSAVPYDLTDTWDPTHGYSKSIYEFYAALVTEFPNTFPYIAVGNEPNAPTFWAGTYEEYVRLLQTAAKAIHDTDPSVKVIDGGIASEAWGCIAYDSLLSGRWNEQQAVEFVRGLYEASRRGEEFAAASEEEIITFLHTDTEIIAECSAREAYFRGLVGHVDAVNFHYYEHIAYLDEVIDYLEDTMREYGWQDPVIVTNELGNKEWNNPDYDVEDVDQARDLRAKLEYVRQRGLPLVVWFSVNGDDSETGGFLSTHAKDGTPYEAAREYRRFLEEQAAQ